MEIVSREKYALKLDSWIGKGQIIVVTGQRRSGKSYVLKDFIQRHSKDESYNIIYINKEKKDFDGIKTYNDLNDYIDSKFDRSKHNVILVDEIQDIAEWERSVRSYRTEDNTDVIITGSNSRILSSELGTMIGGRYQDVFVQPLTYREFLEFHNLQDNDDSLVKYINVGGLPGLRRIGLDDDEQVSEYVRSVFNTIMLKDVIERHDIRNIPFLNNLVAFLADNVGKLNSATNIMNTMKAHGQNVATKIILDYISFFSEAYLLSDVRRYDIHGKKEFEFNDKVYFSDLGIRNTIAGGERSGDIEKVIENVVYNQLVYDGFTVRVGQLRAGEIDFVCTKPGQRVYVQVSYLITDEDVIEREFGNLKKINDNYPKYVISMTPLVKRSDDDGIFHLSLREFLYNGL